MPTKEECPRCFGLGRTGDDDKYDRDCSCKLLERIADLEGALGFYADADNYKASAPGLAPKIAGDAWGNGKTLKDAVEAVLRYLPTVCHKEMCRQLIDRECGFCDCGYEAAMDLRKRVHDLASLRGPNDGVGFPGDPSPP
jgi:hypothetical protein